MIDNKIIEQFANKLNDSLPPLSTDIKDKGEKHLHFLLEGMLSKMNLVTREEFDVQTAVLQRTRQKLEELEKQLAELEQQKK